MKHTNTKKTLLLSQGFISLDHDEFSLVYLNNKRVTIFRKLKCSSGDCYKFCLKFISSGLVNIPIPFHWIPLTLCGGLVDAMTLVESRGMRHSLWILSNFEKIIILKFASIAIIVWERLKQVDIIYQCV